MSSPKARFTGAQPPSRVRDLTYAEVLRLRDLWPKGGIESAWGHPGDEFAASLGDIVLGVRAGSIALCVKIRGKSAYYCP